ncbi:MAG: hypothetical protein ICV53_13425 [Flavisolibacter sp.]|nr:hypothetical protein [Flavisolibacter sp.]MBD0367089.1 hypothetical protein [Flavisolibacter sp.]
MLDEIISAVKPPRRSKMLVAEPKMTGALPDIDSKISFLPLLNYLKEKRSEVSDIKSGFYKFLIKKIEAEPELLTTINDSALLEEHSDLLELLSTMLFPVVSKHEKQTFALATPYRFQVFYYSDCFRQLFMDAHEQQLLLPAGLSPEELKVVECSMVYDHVLEKFYGVKLNESPELIYPVADTQTGLKKYYRIRYDRRFIDVQLKGKLPPIQDCAVCLNTFRILDLEKQLQKMPLDLFAVEGFAVWAAEDVTRSEALETIKKVLLRQSSYDTNIQELKAALQVLVGLNEVEIGLMPFVKINDRFVLEEDFTRHSLVGKHWQADDAKSLECFQKFIGFVTERSGPMPVSQLSETMLGFAPHMRPVFESGVRSYIHYPMQNSDGLIGMLELASPVPHLLTQEVLSRLEPAVPLLSVALLKNRDTFLDNIEKLIKEKFTALQQSVEWKFAEVAWNYLRSKENCPCAADVVFDSVYPLYGAVDIRNSSQERNHAIQKDLKEHLLFIDETLDHLQAQISLPLLEGLKFKIHTVQQSIQDSIMTEDEVRVNEFIENEVQPVFNLLRKSHLHARSIVDTYFNTVNDNGGRLYQNHREYEETVNTITDAVLQYLEEEEDQLQKTYPHYFERYRTDGVDYNIYIGQSIAPHQPFDPLYLKNIRLWQLKAMAEAARITNRLLPSMKLPLQTTQLVLAHSNCISISFRCDERRFEVEGAYNIRYATIKKRLEKAHVKDTHERLTQPGKLAIVYSNQKEVQEYGEYINFLQNKDLLKPEIEFLELEELQGVRGLKAMRVEINL